MADWQKGHSRKLFIPSTSAAWPLFTFLQTLSSTRFVFVSRGEMNQFSLPRTLISRATSGGASGRGKNTHRHNIFKRITHLKTSYGSTRVCVLAAWRRAMFGKWTFPGWFSQGGMCSHSGWPPGNIWLHFGMRWQHVWLIGHGSTKTVSGTMRKTHSMQSASSPFTSLNTGSDSR